jgi:ParB family chromosome partitioning protein
MASIKIKAAAASASNADLSMLFGAAGMPVAAGGSGQIQDVPLDKLDRHPKQGRWHMDEDEINWLANNIAENGILQPICVMPEPNGRYLLLAGHKRTEAAKRAGLKTAPAIVEPYDETRGDIIFNATNLGGREKLLPSEKAWAYVDLEADCHAGSKTTAALAELTGDNVRMIQRYKRLTQLTPELLELVNKECIPVFAGVELSYLAEEEQTSLYNVLVYHNSEKVSLKQAAALKASSLQATLTDASIEDILFPSSLHAAKPPVFKLRIEDFGGLIPAGYDNRQVCDLIRQALAFFNSYSKDGRYDESSHSKSENESEASQ